MASNSDPDIRLLRALADLSRRAILRRLQFGGSVAACDLDCCDVHQPTVSHHLKVLREAGWVRSERRATRVYNSLEPAAAERLRAISGELMRPPTVRQHGQPVHRPVVTKARE